MVMSIQWQMRGYVEDLIETMEDNADYCETCYNPTCSIPIVHNSYCKDKVCDCNKCDHINKENLYANY